MLEREDNEKKGKHKLRGDREAVKGVVAKSGEE